MSESRPTVFSVTVFPPVFGPVITSASAALAAEAARVLGLQERAHIRLDEVYGVDNGPNEPWEQPPMPEGKSVREGILRGMYRFKASEKKHELTEDDRDKVKEDIQELTKQYESQAGDLAKAGALCPRFEPATLACHRILHPKAEPARDSQLWYPSGA